MAIIAIVGFDEARRATYTETLDCCGHTVDIIVSDIEAIRYLVRQKKAPDVLVLDMQWPGSTEVVALGAVQRLQHLVHTKVLIITRNGSKVPRSWGADITLSSPVAPLQLAHAIKGMVGDPNDSTEAIASTRIWWDGQEAKFLRWTEQALVLAWADATETAVKLPRGAAVRLIKQGVLQIEGPAPTWAQLPLVPLGKLQAAKPEAHAEETNVNPFLAKRQPRPASQATSPPAPAQSKQPMERAEKLSIITRLIRKLSGDSSSKPLQDSSQALPQ